MMFSKNLKNNKYQITLHVEHMSYNILMDELPSHFVYYQVDNTQTACKFLMMPSKPNGANLSALNEIYAIAVYFDDKQLKFKKLPKQCELSLQEVNLLIDLTSPNKMPVQKIKNVTTKIDTYTKNEISSTVNYTKPSISKMVKDSKCSDVSTYVKNVEYRNGQRFNTAGRAINMDLTIDDFIVSGKSDEEKYEDIFYTPCLIKNGIKVFSVFDRYGDRVQISFSNSVVSANDCIMLNETTPYEMKVSISDGVNTRDDATIIYQLDRDGNKPTAFFDAFGNTVVGVFRDSLVVKRTRLPILHNEKGEALEMSIEKNASENWRMIDVVTRI